MKRVTVSKKVLARGRCTNCGEVDPPVDTRNDDGKAAGAVFEECLAHDGGTVRLYQPGESYLMADEFADLFAQEHPEATLHAEPERALGEDYGDEADVARAKAERERIAAAAEVS